MAEGLLNAPGSGQWKAQSAGVISSYVHPLAIQVMEEIGMDISKKTSKSVDRFINEKFDYVITLCDHAAEFCPTSAARADDFIGPLKILRGPVEPLRRDWQYLEGSEMELRKRSRNS